MTHETKPGIRLGYKSNLQTRMIFDINVQLLELDGIQNQEKAINKKFSVPDTFM